MSAPLPSGSRAEARHGAAWQAPSTPLWEEEARDAAATDAAEAAAAHKRARNRTALLALAGLAAAALPAIYPLTPGFAAANTTAVVLAAIVAGAAGIGIVALAERVGRELRPRSRASGRLVFIAAVASAGAAAIHLAVARPHLEEYALFGVFFALSGLVQLGWALFVVVRPRRWLLRLGAAGNLAIVALWAVDRIWGLPLGPEHWQPEPVGFGDAAAGAFEVTLALACVLLLRRGRGMAAVGRLRSRERLLIGGAALALTALGLLSALAIGSPVIAPSA